MTHDRMITKERDVFFFFLFLSRGQSNAKSGYRCIKEKATMTRLCGHRILEILILTSLGSFLLLPRNEYIPVASAYIGFWPRNQVSKVSENKIQINEINLINISDDQLIKFPIQTISKVGTK